MSKQDIVQINYLKPRQHYLDDEPCVEWISETISICCSFCNSEYMSHDDDSDHNGNSTNSSVSTLENQGLVNIPNSLVPCHTFLDKHSKPIMRSTLKSSLSDKPKELNNSLKFRRPSNSKLWNISTNKSESMTMCDTLSNHSLDDHRKTNTQELMSESDYKKLQQRISLLVDNTKNIRGFSSSSLLKNKMYQLLLTRDSSVKDESLFKTFDFDRGIQYKTQRQVNQKRDTQMISHSAKLYRRWGSADKGDSRGSKWQLSSLLNYFIEAKH